MKKKHFWFSVILVALCVSLYGQLGIGNGRIVGTVMDDSGKAIKGAKISAMNLTYKNTYSMTTNKKGQWSLSGLASGRYEIKVAVEGFAESQTVLDISFAQERVQKLDVTLKRTQVVVPPDEKTVKRQAYSSLVKEGNALMDQKQYSEAVAKFRQALAENPSTYAVNINVGNCLLELKENAKALEAYQGYLDGIKADKGSWNGDAQAAQVLGTIGRIHLEQQDIEKAKEYFKQAIDTFPNDEIIPYNLGEILFNQGQSAEAIEYMKTAVKLKEGWAPPYLKLGYAYLNTGEFTLALESLKKFLELAPDDPQAPAVKALIPQVEELAKKKK
jgi:tetratricopeptide (TPR) repeat protein